MDNQTIPLIEDRGIKSYTKRFLIGKTILNYLDIFNTDLVVIESTLTVPQKTGAQSEINRSPS